MEITVNGKKEVVSTGTQLSDVLSKRNIAASTARGVAVAVNERIIRRTEWEDTPIESGSAIEIVTARQGG